MTKGQRARKLSSSASAAAGRGVSESILSVLAQAIISLGHALALKVIAEGVETDAQLRFLAKHHCDEVQGFYFGEPVAPEAFAKLLARNKARKKRSF